MKSLDALKSRSCIVPTNISFAANFEPTFLVVERATLLETWLV